MNIEPNESNKAFAAAISARLKSESRLVGAKSVIWWFMGVGVMAAGIGVGIAAILWGFGQYQSFSQPGEQIAKAIVDGLKGANLVGTVKIDPDAKLPVSGEVKLADGTAIKLTPPDQPVRMGLADDARLKMDPNATVRIDQIPGQIREFGRAQPTDTKATARVVTSYTIFKEVTFSNGRVVTGWDFATSEDSRPATQYCYYTNASRAEGRGSTVLVGRDKNMISENTTPARDLGVDINEAFRSCVWWNA